MLHAERARPQLQLAAAGGQKVRQRRVTNAATHRRCSSVEVIRRVQRQFRALVSKQAEAAQELHNTSLREASSAAGTLPQHEHLCAILRRVYRERKAREAATQARGAGGR